MVVVLEAADYQVHVLIEFTALDFGTAQLGKTLQIENIYTFIQKLFEYLIIT